MSQSSTPRRFYGKKSSAKPIDDPTSDSSDACWAPNRISAARRTTRSGSSGSATIPVCRTSRSVTTPGCRTSRSANTPSHVSSEGAITPGRQGSRSATASICGGSVDAATPDHEGSRNGTTPSREGSVDATTPGSRGSGRVTTPGQGGSKSAATPSRRGSGDFTTPGSISNRKSSKSATTPSSGGIVDATTPNRRGRESFSTPSHGGSESAFTPSCRGESYSSRNLPRPRHYETEDLRPPFQPGETLCDRVDLLTGCSSYSEGEDVVRDTDVRDDGDVFCAGTTDDSAGIDCSREPLVNSNNNWSFLLQEQQAMLLKVIQQQDDIKKQNEEFRSRLDDIEDTVASLSAQSFENSSSAANQRSNVKVPKDLTKRVSRIYDNLESKFNPSESSTSIFNKGVRRSILDQIMQLPDTPKSSEYITGVAIQRKYQCVRRQFLLEEKPNSDAICKGLAHKKKCRSRLKRKFDNRKCVVQEGEQQYWEPLTLDCMTEESDDDDDQSRVVEHKLPWRSADLTNFLETLDRRYQTKIATAGGTVAKKVRVAGTPSSAPIPPGTPQWMIASDYQGTDENAE